MSRWQPDAGFFAQAGDLVLFGADDTVRNAGVELWAVPVAALGTPPGPPGTPTPTPTPMPCAGQCPSEQCVENVCVPPPPSCGGDCSGDGAVTIAELIVAVNQALEITPIGACPDADVDRDGAVSMHELVAAVNHALEGCPGGGRGRDGPCGPPPAQIPASAINALGSCLRL